MTGAAAIVLSLVLPLAGALAAVLWPRRGGAAAAWTAAGMGLVGLVMLWSLAQGGMQELAIGGWAPPLGIRLRLDGLAGTLSAMTTLVMMAVIAVARTPHGGLGPREGRAAQGFWPLLLLLWGALVAVFLSRDLFNLYVGLELLTLSAVALVALGGKVETVAAALRYMIFALFGSLLYLLGAVLLYAVHGTLDVVLLAEAVADAEAAAPATLLAGGLITAGLAVKTALFPFHAWLPPAHSGAPAPASALLSALVPKASFCILLRLWFEALPPFAGAMTVNLLGLLGAAAIVYGSVLAMRQDRLKMIVAYSTVAQLGYLFLVFPLAGGAAAAQPWAAGAWNGAIFHALSHGGAKAAMFLCAGLWIRAIGHDRLSGLDGVARAMPMTAFAFALSAITLMGLPPSGGFTAKYLMMTSAFAAGQPGWSLVLAAGGLLAAGYLYRPMAHAMARRPPENLTPVPRSVQAVALALAAAAIVLGVLSAGPVELLSIDRPGAAAEGLQ